MTHVVDASAVMAVLQQEKGAEVAIPYLHGALFSAVNFSETLAKMSDRGIDVAACKALLDDLGLVVTPFDEQQAILAASLRLRTRYDDVSLADRICLALALQKNLPLLTADTKWSTLGLAIEIRQIR